MEERNKNYINNSNYNYGNNINKNNSNNMNVINNYSMYSNNTNPSKNLNSINYSNNQNNNLNQKNTNNNYVNRQNVNYVNNGSQNNVNQRNINNSFLNSRNNYNVGNNNYNRQNNRNVNINNNYVNNQNQNYRNNSQNNVNQRNINNNLYNQNNYNLNNNYNSQNNINSGNINNNNNYFNQNNRNINVKNNYTNNQNINYSNYQYTNNNQYNNQNNGSNYNNYSNNQSYNYNNQSYSGNSYNSNTNYSSSYENRLNPKDDEEKKSFGISIGNIKFDNNIKKIILIIVVFIFIILSIIVIRNLMKSYTVKFYLNGASTIDADEMKCKSNIRGECYLTLPMAKRYDGEVLGYAYHAYSTESEFSVGEEIELTDDIDLYVVSSKKNMLEIDTSDIDELSVSKSELYCTTYNLENKCSVTVPLFNKREYENIGYSETKGSNNVTVKPGDKYSAGKTLYPVYEGFPSSYPIKYVTKRSYALNSAYVDVEKTCPDNIDRLYEEYMYRIQKHWPFYLHNQKIVYFGSEAFTALYDVDSNSVGGITYVGGSHKDMESSLIKCVEPSINTYDSYLVIVHELSHSFDMYYSTYFNRRASSEKDIINLHNKYVNTKGRPLSSYAFSGSLHEFFAELMTFYYLNFVDTEYKLIQGKNFYRGNFPDDMKKVAEKYVCIGKNNFDKSKCN